MKYTTQELQQKISELREEYRNAKLEDKKLIEIRAKIFKRILEKRGELL